VLNRPIYPLNNVSMAPRRENEKGENQSQFRLYRHNQCRDGKMDGAIRFRVLSMSTHVPGGVLIAVRGLSLVESKNRNRTLFLPYLCNTSGDYEADGAIGFAASNMSICVPGSGSNCSQCPLYRQGKKTRKLVTSPFISPQPGAV